MEDGGKHDGHDKAMDERFTGTDTPQEIKNDGFQHKEAYCIMEYNCKRCNASEYIWNARDGVTPFIISCMSCGTEMRHINWSGDRRVIDHIPQTGERIFIDTPKPVYSIYIRKRIEMMWDTGQFKMREHFNTKEEAYKKLMENYSPEDPYALIWRG